MNYLRAVRTRHWINTKLPLLVGCWAFFCAVAGLDARSAQALLASGFCFAFAYLSFGYLVNDLCDRATDRRADKFNCAASMPAWVSYGLAAMLGACGLLIQLLSPTPLQSVAITLLGYLLGIMYSARPFRFKERGLAGVLIAGTLQWAVPFLAVTYPYIQRSNWVFAALLLLVLVGVRGMLVHQIRDADADARSATVTFVRCIGAEQAKRALAMWLFPAELVCLAGTTLWIAYAVAHGWIVFACVCAAAPLSYSRRERELTSDTLADRPLSGFYFVLFPALALISLAVVLNGVAIALLAWLIWVQRRLIKEKAMQVGVAFRLRAGQHKLSGTGQP